MQVFEAYINRTEGYRLGDHSYDVETEAYFDPEVGEVFKYARSEYGRCTGKVYIDIKPHHLGFGINSKPETMHVGWVFEKRMQYEDSKETYLREVWVTIDPPIGVLK